MRWAWALLPPRFTWNIQSDQLYMAVFFWYLVRHDFFSVSKTTLLHYFLQGTKICNTYMYNTNSLTLPNDLWTLLVIKRYPHILKLGAWKSSSTLDIIIKSSSSDVSSPFWWFWLHLTTLQNSVKGARRCQETNRSSTYP